jgi:hypothetical protein
MGQDIPIQWNVRFEVLTKVKLLQLAFLVAVWTCRKIPMFQGPENGGSKFL